MKIACIGGGPAGLYFAILMKRSFPDVEVDVYERNRPDDTFGWGVVFSDETLGHFEEADPETYAAIREAFAYWTDIDTFHRGECVRSTGHGFCGMSRMRLLQIFQARARELGARLHFEVEGGVGRLLPAPPNATDAVVEGARGGVVQLALDMQQFDRIAALHQAFMQTM